MSCAAFRRLRLVLAVALASGLTWVVCHGLGLGSATPYGVVVAVLFLRPEFDRWPPPVFLLLPLVVAFGLSLGTVLKPLLEAPQVWQFAVVTVIAQLLGQALPDKLMMLRNLLAVLAVLPLLGGNATWLSAWHQLLAVLLGLATALLVQTALRYHSVSVGEGGYRPRALEQIWETRYGDCKDGSVLLHRHLKALAPPPEEASAKKTNKRAATTQEPGHGRPPPAMCSLSPQHVAVVGTSGKIAAVAVLDSDYGCVHAFRRIPGEGGGAAATPPLCVPIRARERTCAISAGLGVFLAELQVSLGFCFALVLCTWGGVCLPVQLFLVFFHPLPVGRNLPTGHTC